MTTFFCPKPCYAPVTDSSPGAMAAQHRPFYINEPCSTCRHEIGADGVWVTEEQRWCRRCAGLLRGLLNSVLGGQN